MKNKNSLEENKLRCAACGFIGLSPQFFNSAVHSKFKICPVCGTVRFVCDENKNYGLEIGNENKKI